MKSICICQHFPLQNNIGCVQWNSPHFSRRSHVEEHELSPNTSNTNKILPAILSDQISEVRSQVCLLHFLSWHKLRPPSGCLPFLRPFSAQEQHDICVGDRSRVLGTAVPRLYGALAPSLSAKGEALRGQRAKHQQPGCTNSKALLACTRDNQPPCRGPTQ